MNRRQVLLASSAGLGAAALTQCTTSGGTGVDPNVMDAINKALQDACGFIATASTIVALVTAAFPAVAGATSIAKSVLDQIVALLCASFKEANQAGKLGAATVKSGDKTIEVHGWRVVDGKVVAF